MEINKAQIMHETAKDLIDMIQNRLNSRVTTLVTLQSSPLDAIPDEVKKMREVEASRIRAVMQEQTDLIEIIKILFPKVSTPVEKQQ
jgi:predicted amidohydrolase